MKTKLIIMVLLVAAATAAGVVRTASTIQEKPAPHKDYLKWKAKEAKNKGQQKIRVPAPLLCEYAGGAGGISAEEAFPSSTVVVAHLVSKHSTYLPDDKLAPIGESEHKVHKDFKDLYGNSLAQIRKHLK